MGAKKRIQKIPSKVTVKCPKCGKNNRLNVPQDRILNFFQCTSCKEITTTPIASCCIVCAFTKKKCPINLKIEARAKGLELRYSETKEKEKTNLQTNESKNTMVFSRKDFYSE